MDMDSTEWNDAAPVPPDFRNGRRKKMDLAAQLERLPPHSIEAEMGVLGCILLSPQESIPECVDIFKSGPETFYDLRNQVIYEVVLAMHEAHTAIDLVTLQQRLRDLQSLDGVGGLAYLASLPDQAPSAANIGHYIDIVHDKFIRRKLINACSEGVTKAYEHQGDIEELVDETQHDVNAAAQLLETEGTEHQSGPLVHRALETIETLHQAQGALQGLSTGLIDLDKMTSGLKPKEMFVIAARPSLGKTTIGMQIAVHVAVNLHLPVGFFSLEMSAEALMLRAVCAKARVNLRNVNEGFLSQSDFPRLVTAAGELHGCPVVIDDDGSLTILRLKAKARRMKQRYGTRLFVVDYLQLLQGSGKRGDRQQEVAEISRGLKALCKELSVPIIVLAQLNREMDREKGRKPKMSDLRESGQIEADADIIGMLYRDRSEDEEEETGQDPTALPVNLLIAKQRNGPTGDVRLMFLKSYTRFESTGPISHEDCEQAQPSLPYSDPPLPPEP